MIDTWKKAAAYVGILPMLDIWKRRAAAMNTDTNATTNKLNIKLCHITRIFSRPNIYLSFWSRCLQRICDGLFCCDLFCCADNAAIR